MRPVRPIDARIGMRTFFRISLRCLRDLLLVEENAVEVFVLQVGAGEAVEEASGSGPRARPRGHGGRLDRRDLVVACILLGLSVVFGYARLLQELSDETLWRRRVGKAAPRVPTYEPSSAPQLQHGDRRHGECKRGGQLRLLPRRSRGPGHSYRQQNERGQARHHQIRMPPWSLSSPRTPTATARSASRNPSA